MFTHACGNVCCVDFFLRGYEDTEDRGDEPCEMGDKLPVVNLGAQGLNHMTYQVLPCPTDMTYLLSYRIRCGPTGPNAPRYRYPT
eukprot:4437121-Amphidinium_carterae.1